MTANHLVWANKQYALEIKRLEKMRSAIDEQIAALKELQNQLKQPQG